MAEPTDNMSLTDTERVLLRLFRCLGTSAQEELLMNSLEAAYRRSAGDKHNESPLSSWLQRHWPGDWLGRNIVELDCVGDAGAWLEEAVDDCAAILFGLPLNDWDMTGIAQDYLIKLRQNGFPLPSDFGNEPTHEGWTAEEQTDVAKEFEQFFRQWRERVLQALECRKESA